MSQVLDHVHNFLFNAAAESPLSGLRFRGRSPEFGNIASPKLTRWLSNR